MQLLITNPAGALVAEVEADLNPATDFAHVVATFTPGPAFDQLKQLLDTFERIYATGDLERAAAIHSQVDELGLIASGQTPERTADEMGPSTRLSIQHAKLKARP